MSLRARLVLVVLVLTGVGLVLSGLATTSALRSYLLKRVDDRIERAEPFAIRRLTDPPGTPFSNFGTGNVNVGPVQGGNDVVAVRFDRDGKAVRELVPPFSNVDRALDAVSSDALAQARSGQTAWTETTIGDTRYRLVAEPIADSTDVAVVMAPLGEIDATVAHLQLLAAVVGVVLLGVAAALGAWLVKLGLRPLAHMAETADAIAGGDLDRRVTERGGREVDALASALNNAFDARQASEQRLPQFVTDASHELRTPLTSIGGYAEVLRRGAVDEPDAAMTAVRRIEDEAARMGGLVDDLLLLARLDQGRPQQRAIVDLTAVARDAVSDARAVDATRPLTLTGSGQVFVEGDEPRLRQVVSNLLANARNHTPPGTAVDVTVVALEHDAVLRVTDDGPGLSEGGLHHAFDRFWRADESRGHRAGVVGGSGLGLAIVRAIVRAHGGDVTATNAPGRGASFT